MQDVTQATEEISILLDSVYRKGGIHMLEIILDVAQLIVSIVLIVMLVKSMKDNKDDEE